ncbi:alanine racemase [Fontimonas thermophila]|uniref:Alanine racemase n=1 Tax=Fontimonas thermophila TaxID=1076937 RepID=A0A1I2HPZ0_9GAMM|nr:alanine racemase [Fontimonas thermophila]SFF31742.1 alanine racemase [Fontimonas thermophila]
MIPRVTATVDLAALRHNLGVVRRLAPRSRVMAAVKADAYGHGAVPVARTLEAAGVDALAVACLEEAMQLRQARVQAPIALLEGVISSEEAAQAVYERLQIVVHDHWQIALLEQLPASARLSVWFKLDSGMHRLGFPLTEVPRLVETLRRHPGWSFQGWMTHLACADEPDNPFTDEQIARFEAALAGIPGPRSIANSAGLIAWPRARTDWVRPGLALYGCSPMPGSTGAELGLKPAMRLESRIIAVREYASGEGIGYGLTYRCPERMRIGVVAIGYADGMHRAFRNGTPVLIRGRRAYLAGRVSMDMITVDLREVPDACVGDPVLLWGDALPAEEIAQWAGTLSYELFCGLTQRVHFRHLDAAGAR